MDHWRNAHACFSVMLMTRDDAVRAACAILERRPVRDLPVLVGIDGAGGAGKSTFANGIREAFAGRVSIVGCDDFYRPMAEHEGGALDPKRGYENYFDWRRLRDEALILLRGGTMARYRRYDWSSDQLAEWIEVEPRQIVLVEGVYSTRPELRPFIEVAIFIETPREERLRRMLARTQTSTAWIERWMAAEAWYLEHLKPASRADLVVAGA